MEKKLLFLFFCLNLCLGNTRGATYYSKTNGGNWNDNSSWSTTGYGQATNSGTFPKSGDYAYIGDGYTIIVNVNCTTSYLFIGQGTSGELEYSSAGSYNVTVINNVTVNAGANLKYTGNSTRTHTFQVGNNLINNGNIDFYSDADDVVNLVFYRSANSIVSGSGTQDLNRVTISKSASTTYYAEIQSTSFEAAIRELVITYGTFHHNNSSIYEVNSSAGSGFNIPADGIVKVSQGTLHLSPTQDELTLSGSIYVTGGILKVGSSTGLGGLRYDKTTSFVPRLDIESGEMEVHGGITYKSGSSSSSFNFTISGGNLLLNTGTTGTADIVFRINDVTGSTCTFLDGSIILEKPNTTGTSVTDVQLCSTNGTVATTGGFLQFGNEESGSGLTYTFTPHSSVTFPNIILAGPLANSAILCPSENSTEDIHLISLNVYEGKTFDIRSVAGTTGDSRSFFLTGNFDGINSLYCDGTFVARNSTLTLEGGEGQQIAGSGTLEFHHFDINNGTGMTLGNDIRISGTLSLNSGVIYTTSENTLTISPTASLGIGSASSYIDGPLIREVSTDVTSALNFPIGKDGSYRPLQLEVSHSTNAMVTYSAELNNANARDLNYSLPGSIDRVSAVRYYSLSRSGASNLNSVAFTIYYDAGDGVEDPSNLRMVMDDGSSNWTDIGGTGTGPTSGSITSSPLGNMNGIIVLGNTTGGSNSLPVTWMYFRAGNAEGYSLLEWATAAEKNADFFEVQRSFDGRNFENLTRIAAAGNSATPKYYSYIDRAAQYTILYYRIRQVDFDGEYTYSPMKVLNGKTSPTLLFPNPPVEQAYTISLSSEFTGKITVTTMNLNGTIIETRTMDKPETILHCSAPQSISANNLLVHITDESGKQWTGKLLMAGNHE